MNAFKSAKTKILLGIGILTLLIVSLTVGCTSQESDSSSASRDDGNTAAPNAELTWTADADCGICHTKENDSLGNAASLAGFHATENQVNCMSCHADEADLQKVHEDMSSGAADVKRLKKTEISDDTCLSCHKLDELKTVVSEESYLQDINGLKVNPHDMPETGGHEGEGSCVSCHDGHGDVPVIETAEQYCFSCHHEDVFECGTCH